MGIDEQHDLVFREERPQYGTHYDLGWIGFNHAESNMSKIIAHLERWEREKSLEISHVFIVSGENECIEAAFPKGVVVSKLSEQYFDNPERYVTFRRPQGLNDDVAQRIVETARDEVGSDFDHNVLANHALHDNFLGYLLNCCCGGNLRECTDRFINRDDAWICSELAAYALAEQPEYSDCETLSRSVGAWTPQLLFEAEDIFEPFPNRE